MRILLSLLFAISLSFPTLAGPSSLGQYLAAKVAERGHDTESASTFYRQALELDSENEFLRLEAFNLFVTNGDFDIAVELAETISLDSSTVPPDIYELSLLVLSADYVKRGKYSLALEILDYEWHQPVNRLIGEITRSWSLFGLGRFDESLSSLENLDGPRWFNLFRDYHLALISSSSGRHDSGLLYYNDAFKNHAAGRGAEDTYLRILYFLSLSLGSSGSLDDAFSVADEANRLRPDHPSVNRLFSILESGDISTVLFTPIRGVSEIYLNLGTAINRDGGESYAISFFHLGNHLDSVSPELMSQLGMLYDNLDDLSRANEFYNRIPESSPMWLLSNLQVAINLDELGEYAASRDLFDTLLTASGDSLPLLTLVNLNAHHNRFSDSIPLLENYISTFDSGSLDWRLLYRLGIAYERTDSWSQAERYFRDALDLNPESSELLNYLGYSWIDMGINLHEGLDMIERAVNLSPQDGFIVDSLGWAYYRLGRFEDAVSELERALMLEPSDPTISDHLGDAYWRVGRSLEARYKWRNALSLDPPEPEDILIIKTKLSDGLPESSSEVSSNP